MKNNRIQWIDCAKGITLILVIFSHCLKVSGFGIEQLIRAMIFSFHMPLFFILSCITFKLSQDESQFIQKTKKAFNHLILPAIFIYLFTILVSIIKNSKHLIWQDFWAQKINALIFASGVKVQLGTSTIPAIGMLWFLFALFLGRLIFDYLHFEIKNHRKFIFTVFILSITGVIIGQIQKLPLSFDIALAILPLFLFGNYLKKIDINQKSIFYCAFYLVIWLLSFDILYYTRGSYLELAARAYPLFPLCYIIAISGVMFVSYFCNILILNKTISRFFTFLGRNALILLCVHAIDYIYISLWNTTKSGIINGVLRVLVDIFVFLIVIKIKDMYTKSASTP